MNQSRCMSFIEAITNTVVGFLLALVVQLIAFPAFGLVVGLGENVGIAILFTAVSIARSYTLRRLFERLRRPPDGEFRFGEVD